MKSIDKSRNSPIRPRLEGMTEKELRFLVEDPGASAEARRIALEIMADRAKGL